MISPGRLWWLLRRDVKRGWSASYHDYKVRPLIRKWAWPFWNDAPMSVPIHILTGEKDWQLCAWMLASFFHYTEHTWNVVIHDDGTLTDAIRRELSAIFKTARIIPRAQADATLDAVLKPLPFAYAYRGMHPLAMKIFDMAYYCEAPRFLMLDSDVLFFNHPREIMDWVGSGAKECWFNEDMAEGSLLPEKDALEDLGVKPWPRVNSGLGLIAKEAIDFEFCDRVLGETSILKGHLWRVEQTLFALCASRHGKGGLLPKTYEVSLNKNAAEGCIARHYVGAVRDCFCAEGMKRLRPVLFAGGLEMIESVFAPDWRNGVQYQRLLAEALPPHGVNVSFLANYRRIFPLRRLMRGRTGDILHLHWPEAYYPAKGDAWDWFRRARFPFDLAGAVRNRALAVTAHNLHAHNRGNESFAFRNSRAAFRMARVVFAHSEIAKRRLIETFGLLPERIRVIPHGDLSVTLGPPVPTAEARAALGLRAGRLALIFGAVEPYKGQEEIIEWWKTAKPDATLAIIGKPHTDEYRTHIEQLAADVPNIVTHFGWIDDTQLNLWLCAADAAIFNYRQIFTSGAANLARSWGLPILLPKRLDTVVLDEPSSFIHRFERLDSDLAAKLDDIFRTKPDFAAAAQWRASCTWDTVARLTADGYRMALPN